MTRAKSIGLVCAELLGGAIRPGDVLVTSAVLRQRSRI
jgi:hypothetical protein